MSTRTFVVLHGCISGLCVNSQANNAGVTARCEPLQLCPVAQLNLQGSTRAVSSCPSIRAAVLRLNRSSAASLALVVAEEMDLKDLRIFERVAVVRNLTAVAAALDLSPGTVSKRIQSLEDELGVRLIDRTTRSSRLTEEGRMLLQRVQYVLAEMDLARNEIAANTGQPAGRITITAPASLSRQLVNPALVAFADTYPAIEVRVDITDRVTNLHEEGYDAAIRWGALPDSTLKAKRLATDRIVLAAAPQYVARHGAPQRPADLAAHSCLVHADQRVWTFRRGDDKSDIRVTGKIASDCGEFLHTAALAGAGILRTSELSIAQDLATNRLVHLMADHALGEDAAIWAVYPNTRHVMPRLRALIDHLSDFCRDRLETPSRSAAAAVKEPLSASASASAPRPAPLLRRSRDG